MVLEEVLVKKRLSGMTAQPVEAGQPWQVDWTQLASLEENGGIIGTVVFVYYLIKSW